jgi:hypothetical protein
VTLELVGAAVGAANCKHAPSLSYRLRPAGGLPQYMVDAFQRSVLFFDLLRQHGNEKIEITSRRTATVLRFGH